MLGVFCAIVLPSLASAHEVYVLTPGDVSKAIHEPSFNMLAVIGQNFGQFLLCFFIVVASVTIIFFISTLFPVDRSANSLGARAKKYAPLIARVTIGLSFLACAFYQATFGPELPLSSTFGRLSGFITAVLIIIGVLIIVGLWARLSAFAALIIFSVTVLVHGMYMLTYVNYLGEIIVLLILGADYKSLDNYFLANQGKKSVAMNKVARYLAPKSFAILRILFGTALIYASAYAKIIHNNLALLTVEHYHLDKIFGFEAHFLVTGAALIELLIGIFFIIGFEIRFTAVFLLFFLTLSLLFFGEAVWPHLILIGIPIAYIFYGYDQYSLQWYLFRKKI